MRSIGFRARRGAFLALLVATSAAAISDRSASDGSARPAGGALRSVTALGRLAPSGEVIDVGAPSDERLAAVLVSEGEWVEAGQPLFHLESYPLRRADRDLAEVRLEEATRRLAAEMTVVRARIAEGEIARRRAEELLPVELEAQQARVRSLEGRLAADQREYQRVEGLGGSASQKELQEQQTRVKTSTEALATARAELRTMELSGEIGVLEARARLERLRAELDRTEATHSVAAAAAEVTRAEALERRSVIEAPAAGEVLKLFRSAGERAGTGPVLQMGNVRQMFAIAEVYETEVRLVAPGQRVTVTSPALPGPVSGVVESVGRLIFKNDVLDVDPAGDVDSRVVEVRVRLETDELLSRLTNLQVDVEIHHRDDAAGDGR